MSDLGQPLLAPGCQPGDRVIAWISQPVMLSDPPYAYADSIRVAKSR